MAKSGESAAAATGLKRRHIFAVTLGNALEFYDFLVYVFFSIQIGRALFPATSAYASLMLSLATFGAGFLMRPVGALVIGAYADRVGRKPAMLFCFTAIGLSMVMMALIPSYGRIGLAAPLLALVARMAQGFSLGGELGSNTAYLTEAAAPEERGMAVSWQCASQFIAVAVASTVGLLLTLALPAHLVDSLAWRIAFLLGAVTLPFGLWLRSSLPETLHLKETDMAAAPAQGSRLAQAGTVWAILALGLLVLGCIGVSSYIQLYIVTFAQATLGMPAISGFWAVSIGSAGGAAAAVLGGWLSDRWGRRPVGVAGTLAYLLAVFPVFYAIIELRTATALVLGAIVLTTLGNFPVGVFYANLAELLPKSIRGSSFGVIYAIAMAVFGASTQIAATWLIHVTGSSYAPAWILLGAIAVWLAALLTFPESAPRRLARMGLGLAPVV